MKLLVAWKCFVILYALTRESGVDLLQISHLTYTDSVSQVLCKLYDMLLSSLRDLVLLGRPAVDRLDRCDLIDLLHVN